ncbi:MAG: energy transducer TonB [Ignavibacteriae bacterium]|nr:MAG: energy transducer TonB [Ignavibacteriota bacterium]
MAQTITVPVPYGAAELKSVAQKYMLMGLIAGTLVCLSGAGSYHLAVWLNEDEEPVHMVRIMKYTDLGPPPSLTNQAAPAVAVSGPAVRPSIGVPVPVPDAEVSPEQTIASQTELSQQAAPVIDQNASSAGAAQIEQDLNINDDVAPPDFVPYEKEPTVVKRVEPKYPDLALRAGLEGNVFVKVWVDKEGKVRKVVLLKSDAPIFEEAAIGAAKQWVFTPAVMQKGPVSVWVSIPFRFRLTGNK